MREIIAGIFICMGRRPAAGSDLRGERTQMKEAVR